MPSTITVVPISPSVAIFLVSLAAGTNVAFQKSGATGDDKDLGALPSGPLKTYLNRLANWSELSTPAPGTKVRWRRVQTVNAPQTPVVGGSNAVDAIIIQTGTQAISFHPNVGAGALQLELSFIHSLQR